MEILKGFADKWEFVTPRESLAPKYYKEETGLAIEGDGNPYVFGYWKFPTEITGGKYYKFRVKFKISGIDDINLHIMNMINWQGGARSPESCPHDHISWYCRDGEYIIGEQSFQTVSWATQAEIQLGIRYIPNGKISWHEASLTECEAEKRRPVNIAVMQWRGEAFKTREDNIAGIITQLDRAGALSGDIALLPEFSNLYGGALFETVAEEIPNGEVCSILSEKAAQYSMNVCAGIIERDGDFMFNTAVLFDRSGNFAGKYRKVHLYFPEGIFHGESPGDDFPVFDLDIGRVGIMICYDSWYSETARLLALKGAELILFPNAGYEPLLMPARAIDNGVYLAVSSMYSEAMIVNTVGKIAAHTCGGIVCNTIDLSARPLPHPNAGGTMNSAPGGRRGVRNSMSGKIYDEIKNEMSGWENKREKTTWL